MIWHIYLSDTGNNRLILRMTAQIFFLHLLSELSHSYWLPLGGTAPSQQHVSPSDVTKTTVLRQLPPCCPVCNPHASPSVRVDLLPPPHRCHQLYFHSPPCLPCKLTHMCETCREFRDTSLSPNKHCCCPMTDEGCLWISAAKWDAVRWDLEAFHNLGQKGHLRRVGSASTLFTIYLQSQFYVLLLTITFWLFKSLHLLFHRVPLFAASNSYSRYQEFTHPVLQISQ